MLCAPSAASFTQLRPWPWWSTSVGGRRLARELDALVARRGKPAVIVSDNGPEMTSRAILEWTNRTGLAWHYIAPG